MIVLTVNGARHELDIEPETPLLWVLRDEIGLTGTKYGCGIAQCGACTVHVDGAAGALLLAVGRRRRAAQTITTIEGLSPRRQPSGAAAWIDEDVPQCGYCQSGQIMAAVALLQAISQPDRRRHRRRYHQYLPLRHLSAHARRHPSRRRTGQGLRKSMSHRSQLGD